MNMYVNKLTIYSSLNSVKYPMLGQSNSCQGSDELQSETLCSPEKNLVPKSSVVCFSVFSTTVSVNVFYQNCIRLA